MKSSILVVSLVLLCLGTIPALPQTEQAETELRPVQVQNARTLLGENPAGPKANPDQDTRGGAPAEMSLTVPKLDLKSVPVPAGATQEELDREGIIRLRETGVPWKEGSNTFIVGHALGFVQTRIPYVFYELDKLEPGDEIILNARSEEYRYRVYDTITVRPADYWTTYPVEGKNVVSLQTCTPIPTFEYRLIVRGELIS